VNQKGMLYSSCTLHDPQVLQLRSSLQQSRVVPRYRHLLTQNHPSSHRSAKRSRPPGRFTTGKLA
jgi:hypothetical protein